MTTDTSAGRDAVATPHPVPAPEHACGVQPTHLHIVGCSHRGAVRTLNQDAAGAGGWVLVDGVVATLELSLERPRCLCVADGAGGHPAGERASAIAVRALMRRCDTVSDLRALESAIVDVHGDLHDAMRCDPTLAGMGTTIAALLATSEEVLIANVGDSRVYAYDGGRLTRVSVDDRPKPPDWLEPGAESSTLTQLLGGYDREPPPAPHLERLPCEVGLSFLLCSDGVGACLDDDALDKLLAQQGDDDLQAARAVLAVALAARAPDNVTVLFVRPEAIAP